MSERAVFAEFDWKYHIFFLNVKTKEWDRKIFLFNYGNDVALGSLGTYFLKVGTDVSLKGATAGV